MHHKKTDSRGRETRVALGGEDDMADKVGEIRVPRARWGGRWFKKLSGVGCDEDWTELADYAKSSAYQVARALNLSSSLPEAPSGRRYEFGVRAEADGGSTLLVRCVEA